MTVDRPALRPVVQGAEQPACGADAVVALAEVGEPHPAVGIEDDVVRRFERDAVAGVVKPLDPPGGQVDALAPPHMPGTARILEFFEGEPAVVADIERAVGPDRSAVRAAAGGADPPVAAAPTPGTDRKSAVEGKSV